MLHLASTFFHYFFWLFIFLLHPRSYWGHLRIHKRFDFTLHSLKLAPVYVLLTAHTTNDDTAAKRTL